MLLSYVLSYKIVKTGDNKNVRIRDFDDKINDRPLRVVRHGFSACV